MSDNVKHPSHYTSHPSGIECIEVTRYHNFPIGNAIKYLWRAGLKQEDGVAPADKEVEDLRKAIQYIEFQIETLERERKKPSIEVLIKDPAKIYAQGGIVRGSQDPTYLVN